MIAEAGLAALWLGAALCLLQLVLTFGVLRSPFALSEVEGRAAGEQLPVLRLRLAPTGEGA